MHDGKTENERLPSAVLRGVIAAKRGPRSRRNLRSTEMTVRFGAAASLLIRT